MSGTTVGLAKQKLIQAQMKRDVRGISSEGSHHSG